MGSLDSIFDALSERVGIEERLKTINFLFTTARCVTIDWPASYGSDYDMSIEAFVNGPEYLKWPYRNGTASPQHLKEVLGIADLHGVSGSRTKTCHYLEYVRNLTEFAYGELNGSNAEFDFNVFASIVTDAEDAAGLLGMKFMNDESDRSILCVNDAPLMEAASVAEPDEMATLVSYLHFASEGDLERKSERIARLYKDYEARLSKLDGPEFKNLRSEIGMLANSLDTRHNNRDGKNAQPVLAGMADDELERWYDYLAGLFAEAILAERRVDMKAKSRSLRDKLR